ncbi:MAG: DUF3794 domain-containing protein [Defluviitaleaceae bacterium]|nr:DUF3794 domain-containing protein [Defluviitaleaceae bacterium]
MELVRENITINKHIGEGRSQLLLEGDIIVPDVKPDISSILRAEANISVSRASASVGRIAYNGKMNINVLYLASGAEESPVHSISASAIIDDFLNMEGVSPNNWVNLTCELANVDYRVVNDRKLNYRAVVDVKADAWENESFDAVQSIGGLPATQQKNSFFTISNITAKQMDSFTIQDEIVLPQNMPAVSELLQTNVRVTNQEINTAGGRIDISGDLVVSPLYKGDDGASVIEFSEFILPFNGSLEVANAHENCYVDVSLAVADHLVEIAANEEGENRIFTLEVSVAADIEISESREVEILEDAYCIEQNLDIVAQGLNYQRLICRNKNQFSTKEVVSLENAPDILQVLQVNGIARIEETKVVDDKVVVEGIVEANMLYIAQSDTDPLYNYTAHVPIRQVVETKGAKAGMEASTSHAIENISFSMMSSNEVDLRFTLGIDVVVQETVSRDFVQEIEFSPFDLEALDALPSMTILVAEKGDSLWSVAKEYNADLEELAAINDLEPSSELCDGQKLLVVKKVANQ